MQPPSEETPRLDKRRYRDGRLPYNPGSSPMLSFRVEPGMHDELFQVSERMGVYSRSELVRLFIRYCLDLDKQGKLLPPDSVVEI